mgnify:FL=1
MGMACLLGCCLMLGSCSSEVDNLDIPKGKGFVKIDLAPEVGFQTKAVDESEYKDVNNYTVQVFKSGQEENLIINDLYKNLEEKYSLNVGNYVLKAFTGEDKPVSSDVLFEWIDEYYELDDKEAYEKEMQKQEAAQTSKKKKRTVKKPAKPLLDGLLGKEGGDAPDLKPSKVKKSRRKELDGQLSLFQI